MPDPLIFAGVYAVVGTAGVAAVLSFFDEPYTFVDVALPAVVAGLLALIPALGDLLALIAMIGLLHWRIRASLYPDILIAVAVARLLMVPAIMIVA